MTSKKSTYTVTMILGLVGILFALFSNVYVAASPTASGFMRLAAIFSMIALISALVYMFLGAKKAAADYFKGFMYTLMLSSFVNILNTAMSRSDLADSRTVFGLVMTVAIFVMLIILTVGRDLGKTRSYVLCALVLALNLIGLIVVIASIPSPVLAGSGRGALYIFRMIASTVLAAVMTVITYAKYTDKDARGTK